MSVAALVGIVLPEGYTDRAVIPVRGDVPTIGFGTTTGVKIGDTTTPPKALARALTDVQPFEGALKQCVTVPLAQHEYNALVSFSFNVGSHAFCQSALARQFNAGDYAGACAELLRWILPGERLRTTRQRVPVRRAGYKARSGVRLLTLAAL